ncbi:Putative secreted protein [Corynebacterium glyciniphilum AJ 3170]|uniref:Putative secreted protein n=1 Tax=Corynebacterium glyciniphilum AJ 3170 TaxID=1404245 RepID=X5EBD4_9CORY|nr:Putative secreted protein [Corynebacterium glyciniphilum AJ 3170]
MGDDGSHRLLVVPCALVVLVLVLMVTACSAVRDEAGAGGSAGKEWPAETAATQPAEGRVAEPVVTEDGRMIQPAGHTGIWFETEPDDPLEKLVYESQRFVGQPVALEPIGERALLPQWEDMPDPCHPEVIRRMEELGFGTSVDDVGHGYAHCSGIGSYGFGANSEIIAFEWGFVGSIEEFANHSAVRDSHFHGFSSVSEGDMADILGCIGVFDTPSMGYPYTSMYMNGTGVGTCSEAFSSLQIAINVNGGNVDV